MAQSLTQIFMIIASVVAVFTIVIPTFTTIGETQAETAEYEAAIESAFASNQRLSALNNQINNFSQQTRYRLERLIPEQLDPVKTAYDIEVLIDRRGLFLSNIEVNVEETMEDPVASSNLTVSGGQFDAGAGAVDRIAYRDYTIGVAGTYDQFKAFLADLESSAQLFEVMNLLFESTNSDLNQYELVIRAYGLGPSTNQDI